MKNQVSSSESISLIPGSIAEASKRKLEGEKMNSDKKFVTLNNGAKMPTIGMGTWHHGPREEIDAALRQEINHVNIAMHSALSKNQMNIKNT